MKCLQKQQVPDTQWLTEAPPTSPAAKKANYAFFANSGFVRRVETETELLGVENLIRQIFESLRARNACLRPALPFEVVALQLKMDKYDFFSYFFYEFEVMACKNFFVF